MKSELAPSPTPEGRRTSRRCAMSLSARQFLSC